MGVGVKAAKTAMFLGCSFLGCNGAGVVGCESWFLRWVGHGGGASDGGRAGSE